jgi:hypothetical protein
MTIAGVALTMVQSVDKILFARATNLSTRATGAAPRATID